MNEKGKLLLLPAYRTRKVKRIGSLANQYFKQLRALKVSK